MSDAGTGATTAAWINTAEYKELNLARKALVINPKTSASGGTTLATFSGTRGQKIRALHFPMGIGAFDAFLKPLSEMSGRSIPASMQVWSSEADLRPERARRLW